MGTSLGAPNSPQNNAGPNGGVTFEEMEQQLAEIEKQKLAGSLSETKLEGDHVPEEARGKTVQEILAHNKQLEDALRNSEVARQQALLAAQSAQNMHRPEPVAQPAPVVEELITAEQVAEAFQEDPAKGVALMTKMNEQSIARTAENFAKRLDPLLNGTASAVEAEARRKYPDEFEVLGEEIKQAVKDFPNKAALSSPQTWDNLVAFVRGKEIEKIWAHRQAKNAAQAANTAREQQRSDVGFTASSSGRPSAGVGSPTLDETAKEVCRVMNISEDEYIKWSKVS